ncbi:hypothetical protein TWF506_007476 [Arthrobotrys conoides]|uniref:Uncharacterized protein n=1 Tax=Arthrobotrys conoides TaxID=74498 RepID=A0AAN8RY32_9PEZI
MNTQGTVFNDFNLMWVDILNKVIIFAVVFFTARTTEVFTRFFVSFFEGKLVNCGIKEVTGSFDAAKEVVRSDTTDQSVQVDLLQQASQSRPPKEAIPSESLELEEINVYDSIEDYALEQRTSGTETDAEEETARAKSTRSTTPRQKKYTRYYEPKSFFDKNPSGS